MTDIHKKLVGIQGFLDVPKKRFNKFGGYYYRNVEDIVEAAKPLCEAHELTLHLSDEMVEVGGRVYVKATALISDGEHTIQTTGWAREAETKKGMDEAQITGAASSYARKYALNGLFALDDVADPDATNTHGKEAKSAAKDVELPDEEIDF